MTLHYTQLHYSAPQIQIQLQNTTSTTELHTLQVKIPLQYTTLHSIELRYTTLAVTKYNWKLQQQLHSTRLHYTTLNDIKAYNGIQHQLQVQVHYIRSHNSSKHNKQNTQLQPPLSPSVNSPLHPWFTTTELSYNQRCPIPKLATALCGTTGKHTHVT